LGGRVRIVDLPGIDDLSLLFGHGCVEMLCYHLLRCMGVVGWMDWETRGSLLLVGVDGVAYLAVSHTAR